ncbi:ROK family transcriptional regulator [Cryobacterium adonitolivorans]|uniref:ROK family transcriptional regulator n=1 Tax=Cryobacterium adonitolivorans TaxID=1259189 RepID=A0A4V3IC86_9MICO|nr:ROK family transcriptional regulator [Cryobacterium adonitolivorans]TFB99548.1 ROK family transcriptional regulator [Cryobacterium adonitolivorans]
MSLREVAPGTMAIESARAAAREVVKNGPLSRSEVARRLNLSPASLTRLAKPLVDSGLLVEGEPQADPVHGRIARPLDTSDSLRFLGVKVNVDALYAVVTNARAEIVARSSRSLASTQPDHVMAGIVAIAQSLLGDVGHAESIGVALGGHSVDGQIVNVSRSLDWHDIALAATVAAECGIRAVVENDVLALTQAQHWFGMGRGRSDFALITVGVGVGCSLVIHDSVVRREHPNTPTVGHFVIDRTGPICADGHRGCAMAYLSSGSICQTVSIGLGRVVAYDDVLDLATAGDPVAARVVQESATALGRLISSVSMLTGIQDVLLSGEGIGLATSAPDAVAAGIDSDRPAWALPIATRVEPMDFYEWARGGAVVAIQDYLDTYPIEFAPARNAATA